MDELGSTGGTQEDAKFIRIDMEEMHTVLDTLGVSNDERRSITNDVLRKCLAVYKQALGSLTDRCMPMVKSISALQAQCDDLCRVLGENYALTEEQKRSESLPKIQALLTTVVLSFDEVKKERLNNLQALQLKMIDLWDSLGVTIKDQKEYRYMMCHTCVSVDEVRETNALSTSLLSEIQSEVKRLEGQLMQEVVKKLAVLGSNLRQTHLSGDDNYKLNFSPIDVQEGKIDMLTAHEKVKELIVKSKRDIVQRAENINSAEVVFRKRKENSSHYEAEMSDLVKIRFFYGPGRVQICDTGADLSEFDSIDVDLTAPETWSLSQVKDWLARSLGLDSQTQTVSVHAWWSHSRTNIYFVLRPLECDSDWVRWLKGCAKRNCSPCALVLPALNKVSAPEDEFSAHEGEGAYDPGQGSEEMNISMSNYGSDFGGGGYESGQSSQVQGGDTEVYDSAEVDGDEVDGHMQNKMEDEDTDGYSAQGDDSDESDGEENVDEVLTVEVYQMDHCRSSTKICRSVAHEDIISNLPDGLKDKILCCLPIKEAVGTCLLSRNWRYTWTSMTELTFRGDDFASENGNANDDVSSRFLKFTDMFLSLHNGPILKFGLNTKGIQISTGGHIYRWMLILSRNRIKEFNLRTSMHTCYKIPSCFFSCDELEYVHMRNFIFTNSHQPLLSKGFKQLHTLHLEYCYVEGNNFGDLVASCPNLVKLILFRFISFANINIHSTKLKILSVDGQFNHLNLHTPYLTSAAIKLRHVTGDASKARCNFKISQFLASLSDVENISLHGPILQCAEHEFLVISPPKLFNGLTKISLDIDLGNPKEANLALCLFQHASNLQLINLKLTSKKSMVPTVHLWESIDRQVCLFQNVHIVGIINFTGSCAE